MSRRHGKPAWVRLREAKRDIALFAKVVRELNIQLEDKELELQAALRYKEMYQMAQAEAKSAYNRIDIILGLVQKK